MAVKRKEMHAPDVNMNIGSRVTSVNINTKNNIRKRTFMNLESCCVDTCCNKEPVNLTPKTQCDEIYLSGDIPKNIIKMSGDMPRSIRPCY